MFSKLRMHLRRFRHYLGNYCLKNLVYGIIGLCVVCLGIFMAWKKVSELNSMRLLSFFFDTDNENSVNPFLKDARKPRRNYIGDRNFRDSLLRREFNINQVRYILKKMKLAIPS